MTVYVLRKGTTVNPTVVSTLANAGNNVNFDCPTNPIIFSTNNQDDTYRMFNYISTDDNHSLSDGTATNQTFIQQLQGSDSAGTEYNNLENTEGYRIKCYSDYDSTGIRLNALTDSELLANDYFVLIHSDNGLMHHFAKITEVLTDDISGDTFEFEPRLGKQIPKNTKFMVFKGPSTEVTSIVAVSAGIRTTTITSTNKPINDGHYSDGHTAHEHPTTYRMNKSLMCSKPHFYFYNGRLDKKNELDHNTKYFLKNAETNMSSATITPATNTAFVTTPDYNFSIVDYSNYTIKGLIVDNLRHLDDPINAANGSKQTSNEGLTAVNNDFTKYDKCFLNARRPTTNASGGITSGVLMLGPTRYLHYSYSPAKANATPHVISSLIKESVGGRGGYAEAKMIDTLRILPSKIEEFDSFRVRHQVHTGDFFEWFPLKATVSARVGSTNEYTFSVDGDYDLKNLLSDNEEVRVGDRVLRVSARDTLNTTADTQDITFTADSRLDSSKVFSSSYTLSSGDRLYRRAFSSLNSTLLTTMPIIEGRESNLKVVILDKHFEALEASVTSSNENQKYLTLSFNNALGEKYGTPFSALEYVTGQYKIEIERFDGEVEEISTEREHGQNMMTISGRDNYSKLISPVINKNTVFSEDIVYSSLSPFNSLEKVGEVNSSGNIVFSSKEFRLTKTGIVNLPVSNDKIYLKYTNGVMAYIGQIDEVAPTNTSYFIITLHHMPLAIGTYVATDNEIEIWREANKNYMFNKALSADNQLSSFATSLTGSADKGLFFESGIKISDSSSLIGTTTSRSSGVNSNATGYHIHHPSSVSRKDEQFQARLSDGGSNFETFDTVNTLMDFSILNISTVEGKTTIEIAPYLPLTLGRADHNDYDTYDNTYTTIGTTTTASTSSSNATANQWLDVSPSTVSTIKTVAKEGLPIYVDSVFAGYCLKVVAYKGSSADTYKIFLDRRFTNYASSATISVLTAGDSGLSDYVSKDTTNLYFINGAHLHGGKYVSLLNSQYGSNAGDYEKPTYYNFTRPTVVLDYSLMDTYAERFGPSLFKLNHIEKGDFNRKSQTIASDYYRRASAGKNNRVALKSDTNYYGGGSKIQYYSSAYKLSQGQTTLQKIPSRFQETAHPHLSIEERGTYPASGSLFWDYNIYEKDHNKPIVFTSADPTQGGLIKSNYYIKDFIEQIDPKVARMFLFATSDLLPYSKLRTDSLFYSNRDLTKFKLFLLNEPNEDEFTTKHSNYEGSGLSKKILDTDYQSANIIEYDVDDVSKLKTFGMMRLTELVFDSTFNQFDSENPPDKKNTISKFEYDFHTLETVKNSVGASLSVDSATATTITVNDGAIIADGDIVCDASGNMIGEVDGGLGKTSFIDATCGFDPTATDDADKKIITHNANADIIAGLKVTGTGIPAGSSISSITDTTHFVISANTTGSSAVTNGSLTFSNSTITLKSLGYSASANVVLTGSNSALVSGDVNARLLYKAERHSSIVTGHGSGETTNSFTGENHPLKGMLHGGIYTSDAFTKGMTEVFTAPTNATSGGTSANANHYSHLTLPLVFGSGTLSTDKTAHASLYFKALDLLKYSNETPDSVGAFLQYGIFGVVLDRFGIDGGTTEPMTSSGTVFPPNANTHLRSYTGGTLVNMGLTIRPNRFRHLYGFDNNGETNREDTTSTDATDAEGIYMGFKLRVKLPTKETSNPSGPSGTSNYKYIINSSTYPYLDYVKDLTGCYLVSEKGTEYGGLAAAGGTDSVTVTTTIDSHGQPTSINNTIPTNIGYVVTHEIDTGHLTKRHVILTDKELPSGYYRVMQPNHTCTYRYTPKKIKLNTLSSSYTKMPYKNETYSSTTSYLMMSGANSERVIDVGAGTTGGDKENIGHNEGVLSMYALVDLDGSTAVGTRQYILSRDPDEATYQFYNSSTLLSEVGETMCISDGETTYKTSVDLEYNGTNKGTNLIFGTHKETKGVASISQILTITTNQNIKGSPKRAMIGSVVTVCNETEDLVNDLLEENDIEFTTSFEDDYPLFLAPNYQGIDLFSAINYLIQRKNKTLAYEDGKFSLTDNNPSSSNSRLFITDRNENMLIKDFSKSKVLFDFYNEVIVYGSGFKAIRKNQRSIKKKGRKTLEIDDENLTTQPDVDRRAGELLRLHSSLNEKITIELGHTNISQVKAGDIVTVELLQEHVEISDYLILQMEHTIGGFIKLELGRFSKGLTDRFAEIALHNKKTTAALRPKIFKESNFSTSIFETITVKEVKLFIRKRTGSSGGTSFNIGFSQTTGFGGVVGFGSGGSLSETTIMEVDL